MELEGAFAQNASAAISALSGRWIVPVLLCMKDGPTRLSVLCRAIPDASKKMLIESLQRLEHLGIVRRQELSTAVRHVEYEVDEALREKLFELLGMLAKVSIATGESHYSTDAARPDRRSAHS